MAFHFMTLNHLDDVWRDERVDNYVFLNQLTKGKITVKHRTVNPRDRVSGERSQTEREQKVKPILEAAAEGCKRLGGLAFIDDRYAIIDTHKFDPVVKGERK